MVQQSKYVVPAKGSEALRLGR